MSLKLMLALAISLFVLAGCAQNQSGGYTAPEKGDPNFLKGKVGRSDELYINSDSPEGGAGFRDVYIASANISNIQIIQPEGVAVDEAWAVTDIEMDVLQKAIKDEFATALSYQSAFNIVDTREQAEIIVHTTVVAIHPNVTRSQEEAGAKTGGAITVSLALVNAKGGEVLIRSVDTKSTDDIWAFSQIENDDSAINLIFRSWGNSMRRGILHLQGRSNDPLAPVINLKQQ